MIDVAIIPQSVTVNVDSGKPNPINIIFEAQVGIWVTVELSEQFGEQLFGQLGNAQKKLNAVREEG